ncbi:MAG: DUF1538 domain-containing protein [Clostridia bacterium]|nr:DUF1538 domain-containing protein [Clostridia bacterium]
MNIISVKLKEVLYSVLPITVLVLILNFTISPIDTSLLIRFLIGAVLIILGLTAFLIGVDIGITPIGNNLGSTIAKTNKIWIVAFAGIILGFFISVAEPDLHILAEQVSSVTSGLISKWGIVIIVSAGIAVMLSTGLLKIVYNFPLYKLLTILYGIILVLAIFTTPEFLAISFDASGATTGALTVPFILALAIGLSKLKKNSKSSEEDSFGLVAIASSGAIIAVMVMSILSKTGKITGNLAQEPAAPSILYPFLHEFPKVALEISLALLPIILIFIIFQKASFKLSIRTVRKILFGILFTFLGLVMFLVGVNAGFMDVASTVGYKIASLDNKAYVIIIGFILGVVTILAEPAVYVLTHQIEDVTSGYVGRRVVMITLAIGVGIAVALSIVRILVAELQLWQYLLPGYIIAVAMMYFAPKLFVGIAFDAGGVASGPMTATFILAYAQGAAQATKGASVLVDGFGIIAMVAMTPLIALQLLGLIYKVKTKKEA